jgi:class 3 adenylate cyclase
MVGPVSRSHNLTSLLDMQSIIRLKNHPEEIENQVKRYQQDRKTLDAAISRAGRDIETVLGKNLVALTPGLVKFSDDAVKFIDASSTRARWRML